jgi:hypothetical protein
LDSKSLLQTAEKPAVGGKLVQISAGERVVRLASDASRRQVSERSMIRDRGSLVRDHCPRVIGHPSHSSFIVAIDCRSSLDGRLKERTKKVLENGDGRAEALPSYRVLLARAGR